MSWLSQLASKTENLLNTIDQSAAQALHNNGHFNSSATSGSTKPSYRYDAERANPSHTYSRSVPSPASASRTPLTTPGHSNSSAPAVQNRKHRPVDQDEQLIAFLNNDAATPLKGSSNHSRQSSISSVSSIANLFSMASGASEQSVPAAAETAITIPDSGAASGQNGNHSEYDQVRMLQNEVSNMNREMAQLLQRCKLAEKECAGLKQQLSSSSGQLTEAEKQNRQLKQQELDLQESLKTKDGQLAVLKVRLDEADGELSSRQATIDRLQAENNRVLQSCSDASGLQSGTIQSLQERLEEAETRIRQEQLALANLQQENDKRAEQLASDRDTLTSEVTSARRQLQLQAGRQAELERHLADSRRTAESTATELTEYKLKAQRILQAKDQLIASLKCSGGPEASGDASDLLSAELEQARSERDLAQAEVHRLSARAQQLRDELAQLESAAADEAAAAAEALRDAESREAAERAHREEAERELEQLTQEVRYLREEATRQKTQALGRLQERDEEIEKLRRQITAKHVATSTEVELETRLRALTENLIQKQTNIESLSTETRALKLQLERAQAQIQELEGCSDRVPGHAGSLLDTDPDLRSRGSGLAPLFTETPWDGSVTRRVKRAYTSVDKLSVRLGVFLKRYPIARIFVLGYMLLLHFWVMIVLFTYTPEMHSGDECPFSPKPPGVG